MTITLNADYEVTLNTALLGYVGETNARPVSVEGLTVDGADRYVLNIDYGDGTVYEVDITGGQWTPTADILRSAQTVSCQIAAKKLSGNEYILVKKSRIFRLRIGAAIGDTAIPSPDVAMDALDRIDAIGRQAHADMQTAVTAAETATTMSDNATKSATAAEKSADTAEQAASRAETAQASAETSAAQSETARQGAENARQQAVTSQNNAKISAAQASTSAQQTTADKNITAGYAKTAKTNADSTTADRQAVQTLAEQVTADKATVVESAAQVATDRKAAETAAQTAQAVADSLPEDYVTAVGKIAENTAEIGRIKLTDKELQRRVDALYLIGQGVTHKFETDSDTAYTKTIPTGAKLMSVKSIGGHSEVIDGEIVNAGTEEIVEQGANLYYGTDMLKCGSDDYEYLLEGYWAKSIKLKPKTTYTIAFKSQKTSDAILLLHAKKKVNAGGYLDFRKTGDTVTYTTSEDGYLYIGVTGVHSTSADVVKRLSECEIMISEGDTPTAYAPFHRNEYHIPNAIKALPGYGWSAGTARNYIDYENKKYYKCVDSMDLGTLAWLYRPEQQRFYAIADSITGKFSESFGIVPNIIVAKYDTVCFNDITTKIDNMKASAVKTANDFISIRNTAYTDAAAFKQAMSGVMLYYELANPIITDISTLIDDDFLRNIEVEAGGSVTFKGGNDDYRIPVPSEEEYIVKLSEIGGTT